MTIFAQPTIFTLTDTAVGPVHVRCLSIEIAVLSGTLWWDSARITGPAVETVALASVSCIKVLRVAMAIAMFVHSTWRRHTAILGRITIDATAVTPVGGILVASHSVTTAVRIWVAGRRDAAVWASVAVVASAVTSIRGIQVVCGAV